MPNQDQIPDGIHRIGDTDVAIKRWAHFGMEYIDDKYVMKRHPVTNEPLIAFNPDEGKISIDPRYIDEKVFFYALNDLFEEMKSKRSGGKGFG